MIDWLDKTTEGLASDGSSTLLTPIFYGEGPSGNLRECRHTYWGEDGYIFYPNGRVIIAAFKALTEFFDDMADAWEENK